MMQAGQKAPKRARLIGVIGASVASQEALAMAEEVGRLVARTGSVLVCGGLGGVMEAAARGAKDEGGITVGILPGAAGIEANSYIDIAIATNMGHARNAIIAHTCDSLIAVSGEYGTLSEIAFGLGLRKPVVSLNSWDLVPGIIRADSPKDAVEKAMG
ncbi:MAG: TIGR00725 family protein [Candidatus Eisenbacteria bacterium]